MGPKGARLDPSEHKENRLRDPPEDPQNPIFLERGGALRALNARFLGLAAGFEIITLFGLFDHWGFPLFKIETRFSSPSPHTGSIWGS